MARKTIFCNECKKYVGFLTEGSQVQKGLKYICRQCSKRVLGSHDNKMFSFMRDFFGVPRKGGLFKK